MIVLEYDYICILINYIYNILILLQVVCCICTKEIVSKYTCHGRSGQHISEKLIQQHGILIIIKVFPALIIAVTEIYLTISTSFAEHPRLPAVQVIVRWLNLGSSEKVGNELGRYMVGIVEIDNHYSPRRNLE